MFENDTNYIYFSIVHLPFWEKKTKYTREKIYISNELGEKEGIRVAIRLTKE
jgi:hypothetical protein